MALKVLSAGAVKVGVSSATAAFARERGVALEVSFDTAPRVKARVLDGERPDLVVAPPAVLDALEKNGCVDAASRTPIGRARMGVVVHAQSALEGVADVDALTRLIAEAGAVVHNRASSGVYAAKLLEKLGLAETVQSRIVVVDSGAAVMEQVAARGIAAVGVAQISEIRRVLGSGNLAARFAGPLPDAVQNVTPYEAAAAPGRAEAIALARFLGSPEARAVFAETGID